MLSTEPLDPWHEVRDEMEAGGEEEKPALEWEEYEHVELDREWLDDVDSGEMERTGGGVGNWSRSGVQVGSVTSSASIEKMISFSASSSSRSCCSKDLPGWVTAAARAAMISWNQMSSSSTAAEGAEATEAVFDSG